MSCSADLIQGALVAVIEGVTRRAGSVRLSKNALYMDSPVTWKVTWPPTSVMLTVTGPASVCVRAVASRDATWQTPWRPIAVRQQQPAATELENAHWLQPLPPPSRSSAILGEPRMRTGVPLLGCDPGDHPLSAFSHWQPKQAHQAVNPKHCAAANWGISAIPPPRNHA